MKFKYKKEEIGKKFVVKKCTIFNNYKNKIRKKKHLI